MPKVLWKTDAEEHDYPAAASYLSLLVSPTTAIDGVIDRLRATEVTHYKAKDILRAAQLSLLPKSNLHVASDLAKIRGKVKLSPVLLVRGDAACGAPLQIADGYHRVCASYYTAENTDIPCRIADLIAPKPPPAPRSRAATPRRPATR